MQTFDQHLLDLLRANKISIETALGAASNQADFKTKLALEGGDPESAADVERLVGQALEQTAPASDEEEDRDDK